MDQSSSLNNKNILNKKPPASRWFFICKAREKGSLCNYDNYIQTQYTIYQYPERRSTAFSADTTYVS